MPARNNNGCRRGRPNGGHPCAATKPPAVPVSEPTMRRWPHPAPSPAPPEALTEELCSLRRALDCQNQLLLEIRSLLEQRTKP